MPDEAIVFSGNFYFNEVGSVQQNVINKIIQDGNDKKNN